MRKITLLFSLVLLMLFGVGEVNGQLLFQENFDYATGSLLTENGWTAHSGAGNQAVDVTAGLTFADYIASGIGGAALLDNNGEDVSRTFTSQTTGTVYAAMVVKTSATNAQGYFFHFGQNPWNTTFSSRLWVNATGDALGIGASVTTWVPITPETPTFVVVKYNLDTKESSLYVFNTYPTSEPTTADATFTETVATSIGGIGLRQFGSAQNIVVDGIRVATSWDDVLTGDFPSNEAEILGFVLAEEISTAIISSENAMVTSTVAWDANLSTLEPTITVSAGAQVTATNLPVVFNGVDPVVYRVTAADLTEKLWNVYVLQAAEPEMLTIKQIQETADVSGDSPYLDQIVMTKGVVVTVDARGFYLQDGAGAWNGVYVYQGSAPTAVAGDSVEVTATVDEYNGLTELVSPEYTVLNQGNTVAAATVATLADMNSEMYEAVLVTIEDVKCIVPEKSKNWTVANATDTLVIRNGIEAGYAAVLFQEFTSITGFGQQYNATYQLFPRSIADIVEVDMVTLTFNVDMTAPIDAGTFVAGTDVVYVTGDFVGWNEPGKGNSVLMADVDADKVYSATIAMALNHGAILYKYFQNAGWDGGEWDGDPNRTLTIADVDYVVDPADVWAVTGIEDNLDMSAISVFPNPFNNVITVNGLANAKQIRVSNMLGQEVMKVNLAGQESKDISTDNLNRGVYFVTITDGNNNAKTIKVVKQ
jgi:hypothetical protein